MGRKQCWGGALGGTSRNLQSFHSCVGTSEQTPDCVTNMGKRGHRGSAWVRPERPGRVSECMAAWGGPTCPKMGMESRLSGGLYPLGKFQPREGGSGLPYRLQGRCSFRA